MYIARDEDGKLHAFFNKPKLVFREDERGSLSIKENELKEIFGVDKLDCKDSPMEVKLVCNEDY